MPTLRRFILLILVFTLAGCRGLRLPATQTINDQSAPPASMTLPVEEEWAYDAGAGFGIAPFARSGAHLLVGNRRGEVHGINAVTGRGAGRHEFGESVEGGAVVIDELLIVPVKAGGHGVQAFDVRTGRSRWRAEAEPVEAGLTVHGTRIIAAGLRGSVMALDASTGQEVWTAAPAEAPYLVRPIAAEGSIIVVDQRGDMRVLDAGTGQPLWELELGAPVHRRPILHENQLLVPTTRGRVFAVDLDAGRVSWTYDSSDPNARLASPALVAGLAVVPASNGRIYAIDVDSGRERWVADAGAAVIAPPVAAGEHVLIGTMHAKLLLIDGLSGDLLGEQEVRGRIKSEMMADQDGLVVALEPRHIVRYRWGVR